MASRCQSESSTLHDERASYHVPSPSPPSGERAGVRGQPTCLDLFCGCGGFTLGMQRAGFHVLAAIDFNAEAVATLRANLLEHQHPEWAPVAHALHRDLTEFRPGELASLLAATLQSPICNARSFVDVIVGAEPKC